MNYLASAWLTIGKGLLLSAQRAILKTQPQTCLLFDTICYPEVDRYHFLIVFDVIYEKEFYENQNPFFELETAQSYPPVTMTSMRKIYEHFDWLW